MTSYAVSRGHRAPLVGKRFLAGGLRVYFCLDSCLVYIKLLTHKIMIMFCICVGVPLALCGRLVLVYHPKKGKRRKFWLNAFSCKQWEGRSSNNNIYQQPPFIDISYHPAFIATHINTSYITKSTTTGCILCWKKNKRTLPRRWQASGVRVKRDAAAWRDSASRLGINKCWNRLFWSNNFNIYHTNRSCQWYVGFQLTSGCAFLDCYFCNPV